MVLKCSILSIFGAELVEKRELLRTGSLCNALQGFDWLNRHIEPLYHARETATIKLSSGCFFQSPLSKIQQYVLVGLNKIIIPLWLVGYEMIVANSALRASLAIYHLISNARSWNNC